MSQKTIYLSGPITGLPDHNKPAFDKAEKMLRNLGYNMINPHKLCKELEEKHWPTCMRKCIASMCIGADIVVLLPGWQESKGATLERSLAQTLGIDVFSIEEIEEQVVVLSNSMANPFQENQS